MLKAKSKEFTAEIAGCAEKSLKQEKLKTESSKLKVKEFTAESSVREKSKFLAEGTGITEKNLRKLAADAHGWITLGL